MNDLKTIANLMKEATESVLHKKLKEIKKINDFTCRVGNGSATNVTSSKKASGYKFVLTYGIKMLESKQTKKKALGWTTGKEIVARKYFKNPSFKNFIVATILHEYAHVIQVQDGGREYNKVHNEYFYKILDGFYKNEYHLELDNYLSKYKEYEEAEYTDTRKSFTKLDLLGVKYVELEGRTSSFVVEIIKLNPKRFLYRQKNGIELSTNYSQIKSIAKEFKRTSLDEKDTKIKKSEYNKKNLSSFKYINVKMSKRIVKFEIIKCNEKNVKARLFNEVNCYNVPYMLIIKAYN